MDESFKGLPGVVSIVDDILFYGKTREEQYSNLWVVLQRALAKGISHNEDKLEVGLSEIGYFGHVLVDGDYVRIPPQSQPLKTCHRQEISQNLHHVNMPI